MVRSAWRITSKKRPEHCNTEDISKLRLSSRIFAAGWEDKQIHVKAAELAEKRKQCCFA